MADELATLPDLQARLDWDLDAGEQGVAIGALEDLSDDARFYGSSRWTSTAVPRQVRSLVLRAAARFMRNPDGYVQSRAGDESVGWPDLGAEAGTATFNKREQKMLAALAGRGASLVSVSVIAYDPGTRRAPRYINPMVKDDDFEVTPTPTEGAPINWSPDVAGQF